MSGWMIVAVVAIVMSSLVKIFTGRHPRRSRLGHDAADATVLQAPADTGESRREIAELRERVRVLERIATDANSTTALESRRVAQEIEALRDRQQI